MIRFTTCVKGYVKSSCSQIVTLFVASLHLFAVSMFNVVSPYTPISIFNVV